MATGSDWILVFRAKVGTGKKSHTRPSLLPVFVLYPDSWERKHHPTRITALRWLPVEPVKLQFTFLFAQIHITHVVKTLRDFNEGFEMTCLVRMEAVTILTCMTPVNNFQGETLDYFYRGEQRTDRELCHMVQ